jgi:hypothetical protein
MTIGKTKHAIKAVVKGTIMIIPSINIDKNNVNLSNFYGYLIFIIELNRLEIFVKRCPHNITKKFKFKHYYKLWILKKSKLTNLSFLTNGQIHFD